MLTPFITGSLKNNSNFLMFFIFLKNIRSFTQSLIHIHTYVLTFSNRFIFLLLHFSKLKRNSVINPFAHSPSFSNYQPMIHLISSLLTIHPMDIFEAHPRNYFTC